MSPITHQPSPTPRDQHALFCGGGSGGHVFPGLAVAQELRQRGWRVSWSGSSRGMEKRLLEARDIPFYALPARPLVGQGPLGKMRALFTVAAAAWRARGMVRRLKAGVVIGTGGYVSAPMVLGARLARRPVLLLEPNAEVGFANRWLSRVASEAAVVDAASGAQLACPWRQTGIPIRPELFTVGEEPPSPPWRLLVLGGSQGARQLNLLLPAALGRLGLDQPVAVRHQCGERHVEATQAAYAEAGLTSDPRYDIEVVPFLEDMAAALGDCHVVISRAGAITLAEICAAGRASLLLPLSLAAAHQVGNARHLVDAGAAAMLLAEATAEDLAALLEALLTDLPRRQAMASSARSLARPQAAQDIADRIESLALEGRGKV